jgi:hypothetical protein
MRFGLFPAAVMRVGCSINVAMAADATRTRIRRRDQSM